MFYENETGQEQIGYESPYSIESYNRSIKRRLDETPLVWVQGTISQINTRSKAVYLTISQFNEGDTSPKATLNLMLWKAEFDKYNQNFSKLPSPFQLEQEIKISILLKAKFYVPWGKFQPKVENINPNFTMSEIAQTKQKTLKTLKKEDLLDKNSSLLLPSNPLRIGLITAPLSAAYKDFTTILLNSSYSFQIFFYPSTMQGNKTEHKVLKALKELEKLNLDVVCLIRGGGAKTDLIYFDSEKIAKAIASYPIPILTGIGHEIDQSIADIVAFENLITPTDCAQYLVNSLLQCTQTIQNHQKKLQSYTDKLLVEIKNRLKIYGQNLIQAYKQRHLYEKQLIENKSDKLKTNAKSFLIKNKESIHYYTKGLIRGPKKLIKHQNSEWLHRLNTLQRQFKQYFMLSKQRIEQKEAFIQQQHPQKILNRGFAILRDPITQKILFFNQLDQGEPLDIEVKEGIIQTQIIQKRLKGESKKN